MKRILVAALAAVLAAGSAALAAAQAAPAAAPALGQPGSLIETYGVIDGALRVSTNATTSTGKTYIGTSQGLFNGSRVGFRGTEGLAGSLKAIYDLEFGFVLPYGVLDQQGAASAVPDSAQFFGRQSWIGVSSDYGTLTFGRQYGTFADAYGAGDAFGINHGNMVYVSQFSDGSPDAVNSFFLQESGFRWDNSLKYAGSFSGITVGANLMFGNVAGNVMTNSMYAGSVGYAGKDLPVSFSAGGQYEQDQNGNHHADLGGGLKFALDSTDAVYAFYFHSAYDAGFKRPTGTNSEFGSVGLARTDEIASVGANYYVMPFLNVMGAWYFDYARDVTTSGDHGMRNGVVAVVDYYVTKDFDIYLGGWITVFSDALTNAANGGPAGFVDANTHLPYPGATTGAGNYPNSISGILGARLRF